MKIFRFQVRIDTEADTLAEAYEQLARFMAAGCLVEPTGWETEGVADEQGADIDDDELTDAITHDIGS